MRADGKGKKAPNRFVDSGPEFMSVEPDKRVKRKRRRKLPDLKGPAALDSERAIFVSGAIDGALVASLTPQIISLRRNCTEPISVFIDSVGGSVAAAEVIVGLLKTPDQNGRRCPINTIVTGFAASAAADLLAQGDYIIAYPHSQIHFHGTRTVGDDEAITAEYARELQQSLLTDNRTAALKLAETVFDRLLGNYSALADAVRLIRQEESKKLEPFAVLAGPIDVPAFVIALSAHVHEPYSSRLIDCLYDACTFRSLLTEFRKNKRDEASLPAVVLDAIKRRGSHASSGRRLENQVRLLIAFIARRIADNPGWDLVNEDFSDLEDHFRELATVAEGATPHELLDEVLQHKDILFSAKDRLFFHQHTEDELDDPAVARKTDSIAARAEKKVESFWSFTITLCRYLNRGENPIAPEDAWWLGLVDEVIGTPMARRPLSKHVRSLIRGQMPVAYFDRFDI